MGIGSGQSGINLTLFPRLGPASGTSDNQGWVLTGFHDLIVQCGRALR